MSHQSKLNFQQTWSMAVGGMVGGGIFSTLGVVIEISGAWTWLSFVIAGLIALAAGYSYVKLADLYGEGGGVFVFLRDVNAKDFAGGLSWILIIGYILTNAVYAVTFGEYLGYVLGLETWFPRLAAIFILLFFIGLNLKGVGEAGGVEVFLVWFKLIVLLGLAVWGIVHWNPSMLSKGIENSSVGKSLFGAASVFMAYEGFQLLTYDYEDIQNPKKTLPRAVLSAIVLVILVYVLVALGTVMLIGADEVIKFKEVSLALAGKRALGDTGLVFVTIGAAFSTGSAINSTLFATARLARKVADEGEMPIVMRHLNQKGIPDRAVISLGFLAAAIVSIGSLSTLVEAASLAFLFTFSIVCGLAFRERAGNRLITFLGFITAAASVIALVFRIAFTNPLSLGFLIFLILFAFWGRIFLLRHFRTT